MTTSNPKYVVLAAVDFDETGERALREACRIAERDAAGELHLVHAATPSNALELAGEPTAIDALLAKIPQKLREQVDRVCAGTPLKVVAHVRAGTPHEVILQTAADVSADVIVLGTHRRSGLPKLVLGSVAERVLHVAHCPVFIALPKAHDASPVVEPACADCVNARSAAGDPHAWCERHSRTRLRPHVYTPSDRPRTSVMGT